MLFCAIAHANLIVKDGTLTLETGDVLSVQNISIEKYNPYSKKWEDRSHMITEKESNYLL